MFGSLGMPELIVIFIIALIVFGPRKLPELGHALGKGIAEFKKATNSFQNTIEEEIRADQQRTAVHTAETAAAAPPPPAPAQPSNQEPPPPSQISHTA